MPTEGQQSYARHGDLGNFGGYQPHQAMPTEGQQGYARHGDVGNLSGQQLQEYADSSASAWLPERGASAWNSGHFSQWTDSSAGLPALESAPFATDNSAMGQPGPVNSASTWLPASAWNSGHSSQWTGWPAMLPENPPFVSGYPSIGQPQPLHYGNVGGHHMDEHRDTNAERARNSGYSSHPSGWSATSSTLHHSAGATFASGNPTMGQPQTATHVDIGSNIPHNPQMNAERRAPPALNTGYSSSAGCSAGFYGASGHPTMSQPQPEYLGYFAHHMGPTPRTDAARETDSSNPTIGSSKLYGPLTQHDRTLAAQEQTFQDMRAASQQKRARQTTQATTIGEKVADAKQVSYPVDLTIPTLTFAGVDINDGTRRDFWVGGVTILTPEVLSPDDFTVNPSKASGYESDVVDAVDIPNTEMLHIQSATEGLLYRSLWKYILEMLYSKEGVHIVEWVDIKNRKFRTYNTAAFNKGWKMYAADDPLLNEDVPRAYRMCYKTMVDDRQVLVHSKKINKYTRQFVKNRIIESYIIFLLKQPL